MSDYVDKLENFASALKAIKKQQTSGSLTQPLLDKQKSQGSVSPATNKSLSLPVIVTEPNNIEGLKGIFLDWMSVLLICLPLGIVSHLQGWGDAYTFWFNFFAMVPLAKVLGDATEELAAGLKNDTLGALLNATFGNAVEMILMVNSLRAGLIEVVKATLVGSILSNMLLVLGMAFLFGGLMGEDVQEKQQYFPATAALANMSMLLLSCMSFALPTVFDMTFHGEGGEIGLHISRTCSIFVLSSYIAFIIFQFFTHSKLMGEEEEGEAGEEGDGDQEEAALTVPVSLGLLAAMTLLVAVSSEFLVDALEGVVESSGMGENFIGIILLPIVGNACEHASAVRFAIKDRVGLGIGIAVGSSTQIALLVIPFAVLVGWAIDQPMDLNFNALHCTVLFMSVIIVFSMVLDGRSTWLEGYMLCVAYAIVAALYWYMPDNPDAR